MKRKLLFINGSSRWNNLLRKYKNVYKQIRLLIKSNNIAEQEYKKLASKLQSIYNRLERMQYKIGVKIAGTTIALMLVATTTTNAQISFTERVDFPENPFGNPNLNPATNVFASPEFVDIDADGDFDVFSTENNSIRYSLNTGTNLAPIFIDQTDAGNPFNTVSIDPDAAITFVDIDADGDFDLFLGGYDGNIRYFKNTGTNTTPSFIEQIGTDNIFDGVNVNFKADLAFVDIDADGDFDAFVGNNDGIISYFKNTGDNTSPIFVEQIAADNPFDGIDIGGWASPTFEDIDNDGDMDAFIGESAGNINYFKNTGTDLLPIFTEQLDSDNPFENVGILDRASPSFVDIDGDGDLDAFFGERNDLVKFYENTGNNIDPIFVDRNQIDVGDNASPVFGDIDADGDFDVIIGNYDGIMNYYKNIGTNINPVFEKQTVANNPFSLVQGYFLSPAFADIDEDGDLDLFVGDYYGLINFYKNTGTNLVPEFTEQTGADNPFDGLSVNYLSHPTFADIDDDGDLDAFVGEYYGATKYFKNTGSSTVPAFTEQVGVDNPLDGKDVSMLASSEFADIDNDGDLDVIIGDYYGAMHYYENTGTNLIPSFTEQTGVDNPFDDINSDGLLNPCYADIDGDGDSDLFVGTMKGTINYFENTSTNTSIINSNLSDIRISVYPNPSNGKFTVETEEIFDVSITNISGQVVHQLSTNNKKSFIDLSNEDSGIYFIEFRNDNTVKTFKIFVD